MGGNMGTPPVPPQPPQVSFTTTAESRGGFNNFLKSIPATTNMIPPTPPMGSSPPMPMGNPMGNIDIFNQPPSMGMGMMGMNQPQMNPMMQPPMQQPNVGLQPPMMNQQPMMMADGGGVPPRRTDIMGQDHMLSYITPEEGGILQALGGSGAPGPMGIPSFFSFSDDAQATDPGSNTGGDNESNDEDDYQDYSDGSGSQDTGNVEDSYSGDYTGGGNESNDNDPFDDGGGRPEDYGLTQQDFTDASNVGASTFNESQDDRPSTNVVNVGPTSNLQYDPQFTADNLASRGLDPQGFMSGDNFGQTTQGVQAATQAQRDAELSQANILSGQSMPTMGDLGASLGIKGGIDSANIASSYSPFSEIDDPNGLGFSALDDPLGLGINTGFGPVADAARNREAMTGAFGTPNYRQEAGIPTVSDASFFQNNRPNIGGVEDALIGAITQGRSDLYAPFTNNPGNLKQAREDLTTESIKSVDPVTGDIKTGPALFNTLDAGQKALDDQLGRYNDRGINNSQDFVNTYLGNDVRENPLANKQGYISAINNAVGSNFDLSDANVRNNLSNAITKQEIGQKGINALNNQVTAATGIGDVFNAPITSAPTVDPDVPLFSERFRNVGGTSINPIVTGSGTTQRGPGGDYTFSETTNKGLPANKYVGVQSLSPDVYSEGNFDIAPTTTDRQAPTGVAPVGSQGAGSRGDTVTPDSAIDIFSPSASDFANFQATRDQLAPAPAPASEVGFTNYDSQPYTGPNITRTLPTENNADIMAGGTPRETNYINDIANALKQRDKGFQGSLEQRIADAESNRTINDFANFQNTRDQLDPLPMSDTIYDSQPGYGPTDTVFDIDTRDTRNFVGDDFAPALDIVDARQEARQRASAERDANVRDMDNIDRSSAGRASDFPTLSTRPEDYEENVGKPYSGMDINKIEDFYNAPTTFEKLGVPAGMFSTALNFAESKARDFIASDLISGNFDPIYDRDGKITGSRNPRTGEVQSGMDFDATDTGSGENEIALILKRLQKDKAKEEEEDDGTPNVFGGGEKKTTTAPSARSVVVDSPFTSNVGNFTPVGYDGGNINDLIARLTGIANPKKAAQGGVIGYANGGGVDQALDRFLASA